VKSRSQNRLSETYTWLWDKAVHEKAEEALFYWLLQIPHYVRGTGSIIKKSLTQSINVEGYCLYEVYGNFDILLRAWLNPDQRRSLGSWFVEHKEEIPTALPFEVTNYFHWGFDNEELLQAVKIEQNWETILAAQKGDEKARAIAKNAKIGKLDQTTSEDTMKAFLLLNSPSAPTAGDLDGILANIRQLFKKEFKDLLQPSLYFGRGFATGIVKVRLPLRAYYRLRDFNLALRSAVGSWGIEITTLNVAGILTDECDNISEASVRRLRVRIAQVEALLPGLYSLPIPDERIREVEGFLANNYYLKKLSDEWLADMKKLLLSYATSDSDDTMDVISLSIGRMERYLNKNKEIFIKLLGLSNETHKELFKFIRADTNEPSAGGLFRFYVEALSANGRWTQTKESNETLKAAVELRNICVHGNYDKLKENWLSHLKTTYEAMLIFSQLKRAFNELSGIKI